MLDFIKIVETVIQMTLKVYNNFAHLIDSTKEEDHKNSLKLLFNTLIKLESVKKTCNKKGTAKYKLLYVLYITYRK